MRKLLVLILVLGTAQIGWAGMATLQVAPDDLRDDFLPGSIITIEIVADFPVGYISMDYVHATAGEALSTSLNAGFDDLHSPGAIINTGGIAVIGICGIITTTSPDIAAGEVLWSMEYRMPYVPMATVIKISTENFFATPTDFSDGASSTNEVCFLYLPEPMTIGLLGLGGLFLRRRK